MAFGEDNDDETSSIDSVAGSVAGIKDPNTRAEAARASLSGHIGARHPAKKQRERFRDALLNGTMWDSSPFGRAFTLAPPSPPVANDESQVWGICNRLNTQRAIKIGDMVAVMSAAGAIIYLAKDHFELGHDSQLDLDYLLEAA